MRFQIDMQRDKDVDHYVFDLSKTEIAVSYGVTNEAGVSHWDRIIFPVKVFLTLMSRLVDKLKETVDVVEKKDT